MQHAPMNITSAQYKRNAMGGDNTLIFAVIDGIEYWISIDNASPIYREIMRQVEAGTLTIADAD